jgi:signal peptidase
VVLLVLLGAWVILLRPTSLGGGATWVMIRGSSMLPGYRTGDLVIARTEATYDVGDIVAYRVPAGEIGAGHIVVHRLTGGDAVSGFVVQGDNNDTPDPWHPTARDIVGEVWLRAPLIGFAVSAIREPAVLGALASALAVALMVARPRRPMAPA